MSAHDTLIAEVVARVALSGEPVEVHGEGPLADALRMHFPTPSGRPATVIETTGTGAGLSAALEAVADLGSVVVAALAPAETLEIDLYADLHVRGITLVVLSA